jgi:pimeloyl-ACP methyl ester carboxylesterase
MGSRVVDDVVECDDIGTGHPVLLVHGVAFGPSAFSRTVEALAPFARVLVMHRRGYGRSAARTAGGRPEDHAGDLLDLLDRLEIARIDAVGVSGGATILAAFAMAHPDRCGSLVLHEPALGPLAPGVHALWERLARSVAAAPSPSAGADMVASALAGPDTWGWLGTAGRAEARRSAPVVRQEVEMHARFAPSAAELSAMRGTAVTTSIGARSGGERREAAGVLVRLTGAATVLVPGSGNQPHLENPLGLATLIRAQVAAAG